MRSFGTDHYIICDECRDICFGFIYLCEGCKFKLDVKCAHTTVSQQKDIEMERATQLHHFNHPHKLILANSTDPIEQIECKIYQLSILGPAYLCRNPSCFRFVVHESCLGLPQKMQVPFHQDHMLVMSSKPYTEQSQCYACGLGFNDSGNRRHHSGYSCEQHCDLKLHTVCANSLRRPLKHESDGHWHNLYYLGTYCQLLFAKDRRVSTTISCSKCHANCRGRPFYRCLECAINFHLECVPMPRTIKSRCHIHHLVLKNSVVDDDDSGEYYCDVCEEERYRDDHVYCCEECSDRFAAHIECALAKVEEVQSYLDPLEMKESAIHEIVTSKSE